MATLPQEKLSSLHGKHSSLHAKLSSLHAKLSSRYGKNTIVLVPQNTTDKLGGSSLSHDAAVHNLTGPGRLLWRAMACEFMESGSGGYSVGATGDFPESD